MSNFYQSVGRMWNCFHVIFKIVRCLIKKYMLHMLFSVCTLYLWIQTTKATKQLHRRLFYHHVPYNHENIAYILWAIVPEDEILKDKVDLLSILDTCDAFYAEKYMRKWSSCRKYSDMKRARKFHSSRFNRV